MKGGFLEKAQSLLNKTTAKAMEFTKGITSLLDQNPFSGDLKSKGRLI